MDVDIKIFGQKIEQLVDSIRSVFGYSYFIMKKVKHRGLPGALTPNWTVHGAAKGVALMPGQNSMKPEGMSLDITHRLELASVSKTITAAAALTILAEHNLSVDAPIFEFLPSHWKLKASTKSKDITFRHLLEHTSALPEAIYGIYADVPNRPQDLIGDFSANPGETHILPGSLYRSLNLSLQRGPVLPVPSLYVYKNVNFSLFRVLIPYIKYAVPPPKAHPLDKALDFSRKFASESGISIDPDDAPDAFKVFLGCEYIDYVAKAILSMVKVPDVDVSAPAPSARYYYANNPLIKGATGHADPILHCGASGLKLSAWQLCRFAASLVDDIYPHDIWNTMKSSPNLIGLTFPPYTGILGTYLGKGGLYVDDYSPAGSCSGWVTFPSSPRIVAALTTNFNTANGYSAYEVLCNAYDQTLFDSFNSTLGTNGS